MTTATHAPANTPTAADPAPWTAPLEHAYAQARGNRAAIPWDDGKACPAVVAWLNTAASHLVRPGSRAVVVACALADDVEELAVRGYDAFGIDPCPSAIEWARREHPDLSDRLLLADILDIPLKLVRRFDLVVASGTLDIVPHEHRRAAAAAIATLARPRGTVVVCCGTQNHSPRPEEVQAMFEEHGLLLAGPIDRVELGGTVRLRAVFHR